MSERSRVYWRCRRGTLELDLMLRRFLDRRFDTLAAPQRRALDELLQLQDPQLADYLMGRARPLDPSLAELVARIRAAQGGGKSAE